LTKGEVTLLLFYIIITILQKREKRKEKREKRKEKREKRKEKREKRIE
jgi:hypothetical protein